MQKSMSKIPFHSFLFAAFTVLVLAANNLGEIALKVIWRPLLLTFLLAATVLIIPWLILRNYTRAGLMSFGVSFFALTYGHFFNLFEGRIIGNWVIGTHLYAVIIWTSLFAGFLYFFVIRIKDVQGITFILNIVMLALILFQIGQIAIYQVKAEIESHRTTQHQGTTLLDPDKLSELPDVYFIILDKYGRSDAIKSLYNYDNSEFIASLEDLGFWVADCSRSNYAFTVMSMSSQFNMAYVEDLTDTPDLKSTSALIQNNKVHKAFEEMGYSTMAFDMGFKWGNFKDFDIYFDDYPQDIRTLTLEPFELLYLRSTIGLLLFLDQADLGEQLVMTDLEQKAERTRLILNMLPEIPRLPGHKFVHAHIVCPHQPYLFNPDGSLNPNAEEIDLREGYRNQLQFIEPSILDVLGQILENSKRPPVIILEGDHGFGKKYVTSNLLALYLPGFEIQALDEHMTLINVFPTVFNTYFGGNIDYLPDLSYTHTKDWYESVLLEEWNPACRNE